MIIETVFLLVFCSGRGDSNTCATPYEFQSEKVCLAVLDRYKKWNNYGFTGQCIRVTRKKVQE
jgi:hypothetical protein